MGHRMINYQLVQAIADWQYADSDSVIKILQAQIYFAADPQIGAAILCAMELLQAAKQNYVKR